MDQIDGVTSTSFTCSFEGLYYYAFFLVESLWGIVWLFDFIFTLKNPSVYTGKYLLFYSCGAYFLGCGFSIVLYFENVDNFTSVS